MTDKQIATYCDEVKLTALKQFRKIQDQRKEISILHKKCMRQQAEIEKLTGNLKIVCGIAERQEADNERLKKLLAEEEAHYQKCAKRFYKEGVKDFAERFLKIVHDNHYLLVDRINSKDYGMFTIGIEQAVDEAKKEMVGETE